MADSDHALELRGARGRGSRRRRRPAAARVACSGAEDRRPQISGYSSSSFLLPPRCFEGVVPVPSSSSLPAAAAAGGGGGGVFVILREEMRPLVVVVFGREGNGPNAYTQHEEASRWTRLAADAILLLLRRRCCSRLPPLMINVIGSPPLVRLFFALHAARGLSRRHGNTSLIATDVRHELCRCYCMHACACIHARGRVIHTIVLFKGIWRQGVTMTSPPPGSPLHQIKTPKK